MTRLQAQHVVVRKGLATLLSSVSAVVESGRLTAVVGPNGAGKTTLLRCLAGLETVADGRVRLDEHDLAMLGSYQRGQRIAWIPRPEQLTFPFTVRETVMLGRYPRHRGCPTMVDQHAVDEAMAATKITVFADRLVPSLSVGELQKVMVSRALAVQPDVLLADEPFANLDAGAVISMARLLRRLTERGVAVCVSMHDLALAREVADDVVLLSRGAILGQGPAREVIEPRNVSRAYGVDSSIEHLSDGSELLVVKHARDE